VEQVILSGSGGAPGRCDGKLFTGPELAAAAAHTVRTARDRFGVRRAALFWRDAGSDSLTCIATAGDEGAEGWLGRTLAAGIGMAGRAVAEGGPVWSPDLLADPRVPIAAWLRERLEAEDLRSVAAAPLRVGGVVRGALGLLDPAGRTYGDADLGRLAGFADEAARELERAIG
jgi:GAF domain-containing protein